jgi:DNA polymerase-3 subunit epsilon
MITAWDFETTNLVDFKMRSNDPKQPHIVSMALVHYEEDGTEISSRLVFVKPNGWTSEPKALETHGLTDEFLSEHGIPEEHAIALWLVAMAKSRLRVAHSEQFDRRVARVAMVRAGYERDVIELIEARPSFCTLNASKPIVNLPPTEKMKAANFTGPKPPSLVECVRHFFSEEMQGAHGALADARGAGRVFFHLQKLASGEPKA